MKEHIKRMIENSRDALPLKGTKGYDKAVERFEKMIAESPELKKVFSDKSKAAQKTLEVQHLNGIGLNMDSELRYYLNEFNYRSWKHGHRSMPLMFNVMEAFFHLNKNLNYWELLDEEDYLISFFDFIDYYTSNDFDYDINSIKERLTDGLIYNYNVGADINEITFSTDDGQEFVIAGISILRWGHEVTFLFLSGEITDTEEQTLELLKIPLEKVTGKEYLDFAEDRVHEAVRLNNNPNWWKVLIACRFDLETQTIDARYVAKDEGNLYSIHTDDITGFFDKGNKMSDDSKKLYENSLIHIKKYSSIFELAKACLYLPEYFNTFEDRIQEEDHETKFKSATNSPMKKAAFKNVEDRFKIRTRSLWLLDTKNKFSPDRVILRDDKFKVESSGYWKELAPEEFGIDKKGRQVTGKTWVNRTESYFQGNTDELIVSKAEQKNEYEGPEAGYIYVMRNASFEPDIFKIGLTSRETKERARQLSKTSVPDQFFVMREWAAKNCRKAEAEVHRMLDKYRTDPRREFFKIDMKIASETIDRVVGAINKEADA